MNADDLVAALNERGFKARKDDSFDGVEKIQIRRPEDGATRTPHEISIENGVPFWPWGTPIRPATDDEYEDDPKAIAAQLDRFLSERVNFSVSGG